MHRSSKVFSVLELGLVAFGAAACSTASPANHRTVVRYESEDARASCDASLERHIAYAVAEGSTSVCLEGAWVTVNSAAGAGATGATGATGSASLATVTPEPAGVNCSAGGYKLVFYVDANANGLLDASEAGDVRTVYACNAAEGDAGATGSAGATGETGASGATGATGTVGQAGPTGASGQVGAVGSDGCPVAVAGVSELSVARGSGSLTCAGRFAGTLPYVCAGGLLSATGACSCAPRYTGSDCAACVAPYVLAGLTCVTGSLTFTKANNTDPTLAANQDCIKPDVCITRGPNKSIYNAADSQGAIGTNDPTCSATAPIGTAPSGTRWAKGACGATTTPFGAFLSSSFALCNPPTILNVPACLFLPAYGEYYDVTFTAWTQNAAGGGFAYVRSAAPSIVTP